MNASLPSEPNNAAGLELETLLTEREYARVIERTIARLHHLSSAAVTTLGKVMLEPSTPPATRVRAADSILDHTIKAIEIEGLKARLAELERTAEATAAGRSGR